MKIAENNKADLSRMPYRELSDELSRIRSVQKKIRIIMDIQEDKFNSFSLSKYRQELFRKLALQSILIQLEIQLRADMIPIQAIYKRLYDDPVIC